MKIEPRLVEKPWGGSWLASHYGLKADQQIGEAWLLSTLPEGESKLDGHPLSKTLGRLLSFVVKIIDAKESLSVQVHPNDEWAAKLENSKGKTECWLILDAKPGAGVYLGLRDGVSPGQFETTLRSGQSVKDLIQFFPVSRGDFVTVPAGTIHAIGGGVTLLEVQQASGITYRLWDWGRPGRELHIEKGLKVSNYLSQFAIKPNLFSSKAGRVLLSHADFECEFNQSHGEGWYIDLDSYEAYRSDKPHSGFFIFVGDSYRKGI